MKKIMKTLAAVLCCALLTTVFTACSKDEDSNNNTQSASKPEKAVMNYTLVTNAETLAAFDFIIRYYDASGQEQRETVAFQDAKNAEGKSVKQWVKDVTQKLPAKLGLHLALKLKEGIDLEQPHPFQYDSQLLLQSLTSDNGMLDTKDSHRHGAGQLKKDNPKLQEYIAGYVIQNLIVTFDANGKAPKDDKGQVVATPWE